MWHVADAQQLVCGCKEEVCCAMGTPHSLARDMLVALRTVTSVLKTLEPNFESRQPGTTIVRAKEGSCVWSAQGSLS